MEKKVKRLSGKNEEKRIVMSKSAKDDLSKLCCTSKQFIFLRQQLKWYADQVIFGMRKYLPVFSKNEISKTLCNDRFNKIGICYSMMVYDPSLQCKKKKEVKVNIDSCNQNIEQFQQKSEQMQGTENQQQQNQQPAVQTVGNKEAKEANTAIHFQVNHVEDVEFRKH